MTSRTHEARFLNRLRQAEGGLVRLDDLAQAIWGHRKDGGPQDIQNNLRQYAFRLRRDGFPVFADSPGYANGYRFIPTHKEILDMPDTLPTPEQTITQLRNTLRMVRAEGREACFQRDQANTRALNLAAEIDGERDVTNQILKALGQTLADAGITGIQVVVDRRKKMVQVIKKQTEATVSNA
jgi:hypothetical protein